jgi:hypothetical protein
MSSSLLPLDSSEILFSIRPWAIKFKIKSTRIRIPRTTDSSGISCWSRTIQVSRSSSLLPVFFRYLDSKKYYTRKCLPFHSRGRKNAHLSAAVLLGGSSFVIATYFYLRLIPQDLSALRLDSPHFVCGPGLARLVPAGDIFPHPARRGFFSNLLN